MYSGITNEFLYTAVQINCAFADDIPKSRGVNPSGSGFIVKMGDDIFIVTNRHVLDCVFKNQKYARSGFHLLEIHLKGFLPDTQGLPTRIFNIPVIKGEIMFPGNEEDDVALLRVTEVPNDITFEYFIDEKIIAKAIDFAETLDIGDWLGIPSYQEWSSDERPLLRMGTISSDPRFYYRQGDAQGRCILYEGFSFGGSSGGPVFAFQRGVSSKVLKSSNFRPLKLIGVNAGHLHVKSLGSNALPGSHAGLSYFYSSEIIWDMALGQNTIKHYRINPKAP